MRLRIVIPMLVALASLATPRTSTAVIAYAIGDGGGSLLRFDTSTPGSVTRVGSFGGDDTFVDAIDFRPATGQLFGYRDATDTYFTINLTTAALATASASGATAPSVTAPTNTFNLGIDFNPTIDRLRVVTESTQNIVFNPNTGTAAAFTPLAYVAGDPNASTVFAPQVIENAYTNNLPTATTTTQYVLDYGVDALAILNNNAGTLTTVGNVTLGGTILDFDEFAGFDIFTSSTGVNTAFALLTVGGNAGLYTIDLATGAATSLGAIGSGFGQVYSLAVVPVPEPSSVALLGLGVGVFGWKLARRRRAR